MCPQRTAQVILALLTAVSTHSIAAAFRPPGPNIALGRPYQWSAKPNYKYCLDPDDAKQLTDGRYEPGCGWTKPGTVGWNAMRRPLTITIDLGQVQPIAGIAYDTVAGSCGINWPSAIVILVSDDGQTFYHAGELTELSLVHEPAPVSGHHCFRTDGLSAYGRYLRLAISASAYIFCDEIEVYRGDAKLLESPRGPTVTDIVQFISARATSAGVRKRVLGDIADMRKRIAETDLPASEKDRAISTLDSLATEATTLEVTDEKAFRCILPLNAVHAKVYAVNAAVLRSKGVEGLTAWHTCRWDPFGPLDAPMADPPDLAVGLMPGEFRAETLNVTNSTDRDVVAQVSFVGLPGSPTPPWIEPHEVLFTDSMCGRVLADALEPLPPRGEAYQITIPSGVTKQLWIRLHPEATPPGDYNAQVMLRTDETTVRVPLRVHISTLRFPERVRCTTLLCDYSDHPTYDFKILGDDAVDLAIANMKEHFVDQTWAHASAAAMPSASCYNTKHELVKPLNWARFDRWVRRWGGTPRYYVVYLCVGGDTFAGTKAGTPAFDARVRTWAAAWRQHVLDIGMDPSRIATLVWDEFTKDEQAAIILKWCKPIKSGFPELKILETCNQVRPDQSKVQELYDMIDIFCPNLAVYRKGGKPSKDFYARHVARGAELWTYQNGTISTSDPYWHYRLQEWRCWLNGMTGTGYWAYCDAGGKGSWNPYIATGPHYSSVFIGPGTIHDTKHWEAIREGLQDYEYFALLRDRIAELKKQGRSDAALRRAEQLLADAPKRVFRGETYAHVDWWFPKERTDADDEITAALGALEALAGPLTQDGGTGTRPAAAPRR